MNRYEMVNIIDVNWENGDPDPARKMISEEIAKAGGTLEDIGSMGRRKLAYPINRQSEGLYLVSRFLHSPEGLVPLRDNLKLNSAVIRTLLVRYRGQPGIVPIGEKPAETEEPDSGEEGAKRRTFFRRETEEDEFEDDRDAEF